MLKRCATLTVTWVLVAGLVASPAVSANVDLVWRPYCDVALVGDTVHLSLYAVSDDPEVNQSMSAIDVILSWDPNHLELVGNLDNGPYDWLYSGFPDDSGLDGLNDTFEDGDAFYSAWAQLGDPAYATPGGLLVTTVQFRALAETTETIITILEEAGLYTHTAVWDGEIPGHDIHGELGSALITIAACIGDLDGDGEVGLRDLARLLSNYGTTVDACYGDGDLDGDSDVDLVDLALLLSVYGMTCP